MPWLAAEPTLVIIVRARELRRRVGLTAWAALEELLFEATPHAQGGGASVKVSARVLAGRLGVSKDTAAHALRRLTSAGVVRREDHRNPTRGAFARSVYVIDIARLGESGIRRHAAELARSGRRGAADGVVAQGAAQGALFDLASPEEQ
jgi:DNA-binding transcriptional ArsR family regulator